MRQNFEGAQQARCPECGVLLWAGPEYPPHIPGCKWIADYFAGMRAVQSAQLGIMPAAAANTLFGIKS